MVRYRHYHDLGSINMQERNNPWVKLWHKAFKHAKV